MRDKKYRYFAELAYNGTNYHGWQIQENAVTVQELVNNALSTILRSEINVVGAGRTDTGVHAQHFICHFDLLFAISDIGLIINRLNKLLPKDIAIYTIRAVKENAHARFDAISRTYEYRMHTLKNPFLQNLSWYYKIHLDIEKMNDAANILFEYSDFTSFSKTGTQVATNNCKIMFAEWKRNETQIIFTIKADRFLRNMVRAIVGTLMEVGRDKISIEKFRKIIEAKDRCKAGFSVPAQGLFLTKIEYSNDIFL